MSLGHVSCNTTNAEIYKYNFTELWMHDVTRTRCHAKRLINTIDNDFLSKKKKGHQLAKLPTIQDDKTLSTNRCVKKQNNKWFIYVICRCMVENLRYKVGISNIWMNFEWICSIKIRTVQFMHIVDKSIFYESVLSVNLHDSGSNPGLIILAVFTLCSASLLIAF